MRYVEARVGYFAMVLAVLGIATVAVFDLYASSAKANRDLDAEIDRIIAQQQQKKRLAALAAQPEATGPVTLTAASGAELARAEELSGSLDENDVAREEAAEKKAQTAAQTSKRPGRRGRRDHFLPAAFTNLPKFAATTASSFLRLR
jgi:peptidoglycan hydrolase CwlO-like protein